VGTLRGHAGQMRDLAFDGAGERLASAGFEGSDNVVRLWEASRLSDTLLYQRAIAMRAHSEVRQLLLTAVPSLDSARERLDQDQHLPPEVREELRKYFPVFLIHPSHFEQRARAILEDPGASPMDYRYALEWARTASDVAPENDRFRETLEAVLERVE
jgi:hypothetical protein